MHQKPIIQTERLILRQWREEDLEPFAALNADPQVMEYFPAILTRQESDSRVLQDQLPYLEWFYWVFTLYLLANSRPHDEQTESTLHE